MNPSTEQFVHIVEKLPTDRILILPNNSNVVMAARQAAAVSFSAATEPCCGVIGGCTTTRATPLAAEAQQALAEGWDCSFAYVLASVAELRSETRVEQILGRILREFLPRIV